MKTLHASAPFAARCLLLTLLSLGAQACDDGGTTTSCEDMPLIERHGEGGAVDPRSDADYERWRAQAVREGCATPSGNFEDFVQD